MNVAKANRATLRKLLIVTVLMFGFGFALVPLYQQVCESLGVNDLAKADAVANTQVDAERVVLVQFDANTRDMPWEFRPLQHSVSAHPGQLVQVVYEVKNTSERPIVGQAIPSYSPQHAGRYIKKIECFCFARQEVQPHETRQMPVQFVIDPEVPADVRVITLSYTFFQLPGAS